jgi:hypothetical protein
VWDYAKLRFDLWIPEKEEYAVGGMVQGSQLGGGGIAADYESPTRLSGFGCRMAGDECMAGLVRITQNTVKGAYFKAETHRRPEDQRKHTNLLIVLYRHNPRHLAVQNFVGFDPPRR